MTSISLEKTIRNFVKKFPLMGVSIIGTSRLGRPIYALTLGHGEKNVLINAAHHANEWITSLIALRFLEECAKADAANWMDKITLHVIPLVNPDGVDLVTGGLGRMRPVYKKAKSMAEKYRFEKHEGQPEKTPRQVQDDILACWKANAIGVDLNSNYPAGWEDGKAHKFARGYTTPGPRDYVGDFPLSEPETTAMVAYTILNDFDITVSLHTQGEEIFWRYKNFDPPGAKNLAHRMAIASGYTLKDVPSTSAHGGYRDWFIETFNRPGMTIECGSGENPLPLSDFENMYKKVSPLLWEILSSKDFYSHIS